MQMGYIHIYSWLVGTFTYIGGTKTISADGWIWSKLGREIWSQLLTDSANSHLDSVSGRDEMGMGGKTGQQTANSANIVWLTW